MNFGSGRHLMICPALRTSSSGEGMMMEFSGGLANAGPAPLYL